MLLKVLTPVRNFTGEVAGVHFVRGEAVVDGGKDAAAVAFFRRRGYRISAHDPATEPVPEVRAVDFAEEHQGTPFQWQGDGQGAGGDPPGGTTTTLPAGAQAELKRPAKNASQEDWAAYAAQVLDITPEEASTKTRTELVALVDEHKKENDR